MMNIDTLVLIFASVVLCILVFMWHNDEETRFDLTELMIDSKTNRVSLMKIGQALALLVSTWVLIYETRAGRLSEWLFLSYMGCWAGANLANKWLRTKGTQDGGTQQ
jgi:hypothetical protein